MAIGMAALNTGHNLFYLVFAMLVSLIIVSGLLSERVVRALQVERRLPAEIFARSAAPIELRVRNRSQRRTCYAVEIRHGAEGEPRRKIGFIDRLDPGAERSFVSIASFSAPRSAEFSDRASGDAVPVRSLREDAHPAGDGTLRRLTLRSATDATRRAARDTGPAGFASIGWGGDHRAPS